MQPNMVSVIMPVYNGEQFLSQAIDSILSQSYLHWELVVIDDGSTDNTVDIIRAYSDPRIRYNYQENRGQAAALNKGLELAQGEYITTLDADDWLTPSSLTERVEHLNLNKHYGVVYGDGLYCDVNGKPVLQFSRHMPAGVTGDVFDTLIVSPFYGTGATVMVRKQVLEQTNIRYDESIVWCQDWDIYIRLAEVVQFGFVPLLTINYRLHETGMTTSMPSGRRLESLICLRQKVLGSDRFQSVEDQYKNAFFYDYLVKDLNGRIADQVKVFESDQFMSLPSHDQSRLLRLTANVYLLARENDAIVREWLRRAWINTPFDMKTLSVNLMLAISPRLARRVVGSWQRNRGENGQVSPFELAGAS